MRGIGATRVQFIQCDAGCIVQSTHHLNAVGDGKAKDIRDHNRARDLPQFRHLLLDEGLHPHVLEPDRVHHASGGLNDARRGIASHRIARQTLGDEGPDSLEGENLFKLHAVAKRPACRNHR
jgi:hypothetical protein